MSNHWQLTKGRIVYTMGGKCSICGYDKCVQALEVHHINPEEKEFTFSDSSVYRKWDSLCEELLKCVLVCANCHREIHYGLIDKKIETNFDYIKAAEVNEEIAEKKRSEKFYCKDCGVEITTNNGRCIKCAAIHKRTVERPNREELKKSIRNTSFSAIAKQFNVSDNAIRKWCVTENLPSRVTDIKKISDEDWSLI